MRTRVAQVRVGSGEVIPAPTMSSRQEPNHEDDARSISMILRDGSEGGGGAWGGGGGGGSDIAGRWLR